mgnify:CR=1 FL=1
MLGRDLLILQKRGDFMRSLDDTREFRRQIKFLIRRKHEPAGFPFVEHIECHIRELDIVDFKTFKNRRYNSFFLQ